MSNYDSILINAPRLYDLGGNNGGGFGFKKKDNEENSFWAQFEFDLFDVVAMNSTKHEDVTTLQIGNGFVSIGIPYNDFLELKNRELKRYERSRNRNALRRALFGASYIRIINLWDDKEIERLREYRSREAKG